MKKNPKVAIVADWLTNMGGAEKVVLAMNEAFPDAPIYTSTFSPENMPAFKDIDVRTTFLQKLPERLRKLHKLFPVLRVWAFKKLDLSEYDIIISSSSAESKQVKKTRPDQIHICYCHTPIRYYWSHYKEYKADPSFGKLNWLVRILMPILVPPMKRSDYRASQKVDYFIANSDEVQKRIKTYYKKDSLVLYPPVDVKEFSPARASERKDYYVAMSRQIPYKRIDLAIKAANKLTVPLFVFGNGPEHEKLVDLAGPTIKFFDGKNRQEFVETLESARGFIFPAEEDFGIVSVEALAAGTPVIGYYKGGTSNIIEDGKTGVLFKSQTTQSVVDAINKSQSIKFSPFILNQRAKRFDKTLFITKLKNIVFDFYNK